MTDSESNPKESSSPSSPSPESESSNITAGQRLLAAEAFPSTQQEKMAIQESKMVTFNAALMAMPICITIYGFLTMSNTKYRPTFLWSSLLRFRPYKSADGVIGTLLVFLLSAMPSLLITQYSDDLHKYPTYAALDSELGEATRMYLKEKRPEYYHKIVQPQFLEKDAERTEIL